MSDSADTVVHHSPEGTALAERPAYSLAALRSTGASKTSKSTQGPSRTSKSIRAAKPPRATKAVKVIGVGKPSFPSGLPLPRTLDEARFRALLEARGWSVSELARRWGITPARLRQVIQEGHDRAAHWNDAVRGLPQARWVTRTQERSDRRLELELEPYLKASSRGGARTTVAGAVGNLRARATPSDRSHETALGAVWRVNSEQGDHLPHGCAGTVLASRIKSPAAVGVAASREICLGFETGYVEWMEVKWLNAPNFWLTYVGETVDDVANGLYQFSTVEQAEQDLLGRKLRFA